MLSFLRGWSWKQAAPRMIADAVTVQIAAIGSLLGVVLWQLNDPRASGAPDLEAVLQHYYIYRFLPLSWLFPFTFLLHGFYTHSRAYSTSYKWKALARGATMATLIFLLASFLVSRAGELPRSAVLLFVVLVNAGVIGTRMFKQLLLNTAVPEPARAEGVAAEVAPAADSPILVVGGAGYIGSMLCHK